MDTAGAADGTRDCLASRLCQIRGASARVAGVGGTQRECSAVGCFQEALLLRFALKTTFHSVRIGVPLNPASVRMGATKPKFGVGGG